MHYTLLNENCKIKIQRFSFLPLPPSRLAQPACLSDPPKQPLLLAIAPRPSPLATTPGHHPLPSPNHRPQSWSPAPSQHPCRHQLLVSMKIQKAHGQIINLYFISTNIVWIIYPINTWYKRQVGLFHVTNFRRPTISTPYKICLQNFFSHQRGRHEGK